MENRPFPTLVPAAQFLPEQLASLINRAYADYFLSIRVDAKQFVRMCTFEDIELAHSVVAVMGEEPVGTALLSLRGERGWISGVGVLPRFRRQGIARCMIEYLKERAGSLGLRVVTLEVLVQNRAGRLLYTQAGFRKQRELLALTLETRLFEGRDLPAEVSTALPDVLLDAYESFHDVPPSWQRERATFEKRSPSLEGLALHVEGELRGYVLYEPQRRHLAIFDLAVAPSLDGRVQAAHGLLLALHRLYPNLGGYVINLPARDKLLPAFEDVGYHVWQRQHEMVWRVPSVKAPG